MFPDIEPRENVSDNNFNKFIENVLSIVKLRKGKSSRIQMRRSKFLN